MNAQLFLAPHRGKDARWLQDHARHHVCDRDLSGLFGADAILAGDHLHAVVQREVACQRDDAALELLRKRSLVEGSGYAISIA
jgi:hypothetical protein